MTNSPPHGKYDLWYGRIRLLAIQGLGVAGITYEFFLAAQVEPLILASAITLAGIPVTRVLDRLLK